MIKRDALNPRVNVQVALAHVHAACDVSAPLVRRTSTPQVLRHGPSLSSWTGCPRTGRTQTWPQRHAQPSRSRERRASTLPRPTWQVDAIHDGTCNVTRSTPYLPRPTWQGSASRGGDSLRAIHAGTCNVTRCTLQTRPCQHTRYPVRGECSVVREERAIVNCIALRRTVTRWPLLLNNVLRCPPDCPVTRGSTPLRSHRPTLRL